jgi:HPt (histidine-containing phosphotransfer) domain-containing protein
MIGDRERYLAAGMDDYLAKPVDRARIGQLLNKWADRLVGPAAAPQTAGAPREPRGASIPTGPNLPSIDLEIEQELREDLGDATYQALVASFAADLAQALGEIRASLDQGRTASALPDAHRLAGEAGNLGFARLRARLSELECACAVGSAAARACLTLVEAAAAEVPPDGGSGSVKKAA